MISFPALQPDLVEEVKKVILDPAILEAVDMAGTNTTSELESFHSAINRNAPKMEGFSYSGMLSRLVFSALVGLC